MTSTDIKNVFTNRCQSDPQGVIRDLVQQTGLQAKDIRKWREKAESTFTAEEVAYLIRVIVEAQSTSGVELAIEEGLLVKLRAQLK